jgi:ArsR family transcriptional regulator, arsenate/arsenite/antimonite-responsive transcriptional repressor
MFGRMRTDLNLVEQCTTPLVAPALSDEQAASLAQLLKAIAEPMRIKILHRLVSAAPDGVCVCDLTAPLGLTQPSVSHHLRVLWLAGLVDRRQESTFVYYSVRQSALDHLAALIAGPAVEALS